MTDPREVFAAWLGVPPAAVLAFPVPTLAPLPHPRPVRGDGTGRLPATVSPAGARHPAWWLDADTAARDPDEDLVAYGVRLGAALARCGATDSDGAALDLLATRLGWAADDVGAQRRLARYADGAWDPVLCRFALSPPPGTTGRRQRHIDKALARHVVAAWSTPRWASPALHAVELPPPP